MSAVVAIPEPGSRFFAATDARYLQAGVGAYIRAEYDRLDYDRVSIIESGWSLQGLGMLRKYLDPDKRFRLHVWDARYRVEGVTMLHTHPWDFESIIVAGEVVNRRYIRSAYGREPVMEMSIVCGPGGGECEPARPVMLEGLPWEQFSAGHTYTQKADEIHASYPEDGTVTIIDRSFHENTEVAQVFYPYGDTGWVSAEPRAATAAEVLAILGRSLERWF